MVAIDNYLVAKKKLWYQWEYTSCCVTVGVIIQPIINRFFNFFFKSVSCQLATFTTILGNKYIFCLPWWPNWSQLGWLLQGFSCKLQYTFAKVRYFCVSPLLDCVNMKTVFKKKMHLYCLCHNTHVKMLRKNKLWAKLYPK